MDNGKYFFINCSNGISCASLKNCSLCGLGTVHCVAIIPSSLMAFSTSALLNRIKGFVSLKRFSPFSVCNNTIVVPRSSSISLLKAFTCQQSYKVMSAFRWMVLKWHLKHDGRLFKSWKKVYLKNCIARL